MGLLSDGHAGVARVTVVGPPAEHIREAARTGLYWTLSAQPDTSWLLHQFDERTGRFRPPAATSPQLSSSDDVFWWSHSIVDLGLSSQWHPWRDDGTLRQIEQAYFVVRDVRGRIAGRDIDIVVEPSRTGGPPWDDVVVREFWPEPDQNSPPLQIYDSDMFASAADMLAAVSAAFDVDPNGWTEQPGGAHYRHHR